MSNALRVLEVELGRPLPAVQCSANGTSYSGARVLVRLAGQPLGIVNAEFEGGPLSAVELAALIWRGLKDEIDACLGSLAQPAVNSGPGPRLSVVVPTTGADERLSSCLDSILQSDYPDYEVLVVDNAPARPGTAALLDRRYANEPRLRRVAEPRPGAARARSAGLAAAGEEVAVFVDDDVVLDRGCLTAIVQAFASAEDVGAVTTLILPRELDTRAQRWLEQFGGFGKGFRRRVFDLSGRPPDDSLYPYSPGVYGSGACMAFRTSLLRELGGIDCRLSVGGEDLDAFLKVILGGHRLVYEPAAVAWHRHPADYRALQRTMLRYGIGLTAVMTKWFLSDPAVARDIVARLPAALGLALASNSRKNAGKRADYPGRLTTLERAGMVAGPLVYAESCWKARRGDGA